MPSPFDITVATNTVNLDNNRQGVATFTAKNNTRRRIHATARVTTQPPDGAKWLTILPPDGTSTDSANVRDFAIDSTQQYQVKIAVPLDAAPASYTLKLTVADDVNPDDNFSDSPDVVFTVREIPKPAPRPFPVWIIPAIIIAVLVIVAIIFAAVSSANNANAAATATVETGVAYARQTADALTAVANQANQNATATQNAIGTQNALATQNARATQTALNVFVGSWIPVDSNNSGTIASMDISDGGSNQLKISYVSDCPPKGNVCNTTAATYTMTVPFNPFQLAATSGNETFLIQPSSSSQLVVTISLGAFSNSVAMKRTNNRFQIIGSLTNLELLNSVSLQNLARPTATP